MVPHDTRYGQLATLETRLGTYRLSLLASVLGCTLGCTGIEYEAADFQVDVLNSQPEGSAQVRLCVAGQVAQTYGAREASPSYAIFGIKRQGVFETTVEVLDEDGELLARSTSIIDSDYVTDELDFCDEVVCLPCEAPGGAITNGEEKWTVAVRFAY